MDVSDGLKDFYGDSWRDLVAQGELGRLRFILKQAEKDIEEDISEFMRLRKNSLENDKKTFIYRDKEYKITKSVKDKFIKRQRTILLEKRKSLYSYRYAEPNSWIYKTLLEKKRIPLFRSCKRLVMVGSGMYPYSMYDIHKKFKHILQLGLEIDETRYKLSKSLVENSPAKDSIKILHMDGNLFDYSRLEDEDLIFISCDVDSNSIVKKVLETSKAHIFVCAPYNKEWMKDSIKKSNLVYDKQGRIISLHT